MHLHPFVQKLRDYLNTHHIQYTYMEHDAVRTSQEAHALRPEYTLSQGAKALILQLKMPTGRQFVQCIVPADLKINAGKIESHFGARGSRFATVDESNEITGGIAFGGIPPFGNLFETPLPVIVDPKLFQNTEIIFNCGDRSASIAMNTEDWKYIVQPETIDIT